MADCSHSNEMAITDVISALELPELPDPIHRADPQQIPPHPDGATPGDGACTTHTNPLLASLCMDIDVPADELSTVSLETRNPFEPAHISHPGDGAAIQASHLQQAPSESHLVEPLRLISNEACPGSQMPPAPAARPTVAPTVSQDLGTAAADTDIARGGSDVTAAATVAFTVGAVMDANVLQPVASKDASADVPPCPGGLASGTSLPGFADREIEELPDEQPDSDGLTGGFSTGVNCFNEAAQQWDLGQNESEPQSPDALVRHGTDISRETSSNRAGCADGRTCTQAEILCRTDAVLENGPRIADSQPLSMSKTRDVDYRSDDVDALFQNEAMRPSSTEVAPAEISTVSLQRPLEENKVYVPTGLRKPVLSFARTTRRSEPQHGPTGPATDHACDLREPATNHAGSLAETSTKSAARISTQPDVQGAVARMDGRTSPLSGAKQSAAATAADDPIETCSDDLEGFVDALLDMTDKDRRAQPSEHARKPAIAPQKQRIKRSIGPKLNFMNTAVAVNSGLVGEENCDCRGHCDALSGSDVVCEPYPPACKALIVESASICVNLACLSQVMHVCTE